MICVSETHIKDSDICDNSSLYSLPGYVFLRNRNAGTGGGVGMFLKHEIFFQTQIWLRKSLRKLMD